MDGKWCIPKTVYLKCATCMDFFSGRFDVRYVSFFFLAFINITRPFCKDGGYVTDLPAYPLSFRHFRHLPQK